MTTSDLLRRAAASVALAIVLASAGSAEELSLSQAVDIALKNNPTIAAQTLEAEAARHGARGARALANPEIVVAPTIVGEAGADSAFLFSQPLEINGSRRVRGKIASHEATAAGFDAAATQRDTIRDVKQAYWELSRAQESVRVNQDNVQFVETLRTTINKQYEIGTVPGSQTLKADVELARARQELEQAKLELATARAVLNTLLNRPGSRDLTATTPPSVEIKALDREQLRAVAQSGRPEIASAQSAVAAARERVKAARLLRVPDLALQARQDEFGANGESGMAIAINLPIFDWGSARAEKRRAEKTVQSQEKIAEAAGTRVTLEVDQAIEQVQAASRIIQEYQGGILEKSESLADMAKIGYEKGATGYLEVLEAQRTLRNTRSAYYAALADRAKAEAQLEWATAAPYGATPQEIKR